MDHDRSQAIDLAAKFPFEKVEELKGLWAMLAGKYQALPLDDRTGRGGDGGGAAQTGEST